jgi:mRNA interferase RelE/StbE
VYQLHYKKSVEKDLRSLSGNIRKAVVHKIHALASEPRPAGAKQIRGSDKIYRLRQANYRILYRVDDDVLTILIVKVGHRREIYRDM